VEEDCVAGNYNWDRESRCHSLLTYCNLIDFYKPLSCQKAAENLAGVIQRIVYGIVSNG